MKAMIMAAGAGTRLRPLTSMLPKPLVPIANKPVLTYTLENLRRYGFREIVLNLHSYPDLIRKTFAEGTAYGLKIRYSMEKRLMGTAGGVKKAEKHLAGSTFLVMSGDGLTDINLTKVLAFHREKRALATIVLKEVDSRLEYGITLTDGRGRISRFIEKPRWSDVFSNTVNTGIYVFEPAIFRHLPANIFLDFGQTVFPKLLKERKPLYGYPTQDYWTDVGNLREYRQAQWDALDGRVRLTLPGRQVRPGLWVDPGTHLPNDLKVEGPCIIGRGCRIGPGVVLADHTVVGHHAAIGPGVRLQNSVLWDGVRVEKKVRLENCIIGYRACITENISMVGGAVINVSE